MRHGIWILCLACLGGMALAPAAAVAPVPREERVEQDARMEAAARQVAALVDARRTGEVWEGASPVAVRHLARESFITGVDRDRQRLGPLVSRGQASVSRVRFGEGAVVPAGLYINISFASRFSHSAQPVRELVSFRLDEDGVWRVSGYSVRAVGQ